jgi:hypothetical protein
VALLAKRFAPDGKLANGVEWLAFRSPALFAAAQFVLLFELATMFEDIRTVSTHLVQLARG